LNQPELTAEKFVPNPFATEADKEKGYTRLYRTGDIVCWLPNGHLEFLGRADNQLKIRGHRIEPGEIENCLLEMEEIKHVIVTDFEQGGTKYLVAYVVAKTDTLPHSAVMKQHLSMKLPAYMVPDAFIVLDSIPRTISDKVDKRSLPIPVFGNEETFAAATNQIEESLVAVWSEVLEREQVGINDNFFRIGGNSISAARLVMKMNKVLALPLSIADLFKHPTIATLAAYLNDREDHNSLIKELTVFDASKPTLLMVHPGRAGVEAYQKLADEMADQFNCIGIDNHNLIAQNKIESVSELANYYIELLQERYPLNEPVLVLGWSLGGKIAMEMVYLLEQKGLKDIRLYLVDTVLNFNEPTFDEKEALKLMALNYRTEMAKQGFSAAYIDNVLKGFEAEDRLARNPLSGSLMHAQITHFKAGKQLTDIHGNETLMTDTSDLISLYADNEVHTILVKEKNHWNILEEIKLIKREIVNHQIEVSSELKMND
jgi:thioesterase domain-containing protein/acyl carrier protein